MLSSTSSSNARLPALRWGVVLGSAALISVLFVGVVELRLALRGFHATVPDSPARWVAERQRASELGARALALVGSSRMQLDADLDVLRERTGLEPVQLAINASSFLPVLGGLAADDSFHGTVVVDFQDDLVVHRPAVDAASYWQAEFERVRDASAIPDFERIETRLADLWRQRFRSYGDGAIPLTSVRTRLLPAEPRAQYMAMRRDRSRLADYSRVDLPRFYLGRVYRNLGIDAPEMAEDVSLVDAERRLRTRIESLTARTDALEDYLQISRVLTGMADAIVRRGGRVYFAVLPVGGLVRAIEERRYPREQFWDRFAAQAGVPTLHYQDIAGWRDLRPPDGSHLDLRQRGAFSATLADAIADPARSAAAPRSGR